MHLSSADKRLLKKMTTSPWPENGGPPFYEYIQQNAANQYMPTRVGITRRALHDDPTEIVRFALLDLRANWRDHCTTPASFRHVDGCWNSYLWTLAINDRELLASYDNLLPYPCPRADGPYPPYYAAMYDLVVGLTRGDAEGCERGKEEFGSRKTVDSETSAIGRAIMAIVDRSASDFAERLAMMGKTVRKTRTSDPQYKFIDLKMIGIWQLAQQVAPDVVDAWPTDSPLPWDAELWEWRQTNATAISTVDFSQVPEQQRALFTIPTQVVQ